MPNSKTKMNAEVATLISIIGALIIAGLVASCILVLNKVNPPKATYKCLDGIKYEVKNGNELHIQLTNNGQAFRC